MQPIEVTRETEIGVRMVSLARGFPPQGWQINDDARVCPRLCLDARGRARSITTSRGIGAASANRDHGTDR
jgi:hypothetical protein